RKARACAHLSLGELSVARAGLKSRRSGSPVRRVATLCCSGSCQRGGKVTGNCLKSKAYAELAVGGARSNQDFSRVRMTQEIDRAGAQAIGSRLEHDDQIAGLCDADFDALAECVERRAKRPDDGGGLARASLYLCPKRDRVILSDDLAEVSGR